MKDERRSLGEVLDSLGLVTVHVPRDVLRAATPELPWPPDIRRAVVDLVSRGADYNALATRLHTAGSRCAVRSRPDDPRVTLIDSDLRESYFTDDELLFLLLAVWSRINRAAARVVSVDRETGTVTTESVP